jgi:hypothetical protein
MSVKIKRKLNISVFAILILAGAYFILESFYVYLGDGYTASIWSRLSRACLINSGTYGYILESLVFVIFGLICVISSTCWLKGILNDKNLHRIKVVFLILFGLFVILSILIKPAMEINIPGAHKVTIMSPLTEIWHVCKQYSDQHGTYPDNLFILKDYPSSRSKKLTIKFKMPDSDWEMDWLYFSPNSDSSPETHILAAAPVALGDGFMPPGSGKPPLRAVLYLNQKVEFLHEQDFIKKFIVDKK